MIKRCIELGRSCPLSLQYFGRPRVVSLTVESFIVIAIKTRGIRRVHSYGLETSLLF